MRRFFYHFNRNTRLMTLHFKGKCYQVVGINCFVPTGTKWNKQQPYLVVQGFASSIDIKKGVATING